MRDDAGPLLLLLAGLPFSGKSVLGRVMAERLGRRATLVSQDALWQEEVATTGREPTFEELCTLAEGRLREALEAGRWALYDTLNDTRDWRDRLRTLGAACGAPTLVLYLDTPEALRRERRCRNALTGERHAVPSDALRAAAAKFEPPAPDEPALFLAPGSLRKQAQDALPRELEALLQDFTHCIH